jgi:anaerobic glycerol-3-phosphate dehydrogenase
VSPPVLVLGAGMAGVSAAFMLATRGVPVHVVHGAAGATALWNGLVDGLAGEVSAEERELLARLGLVLARPRPRLVTTLGTVREAFGHDSALLDLEAARPKLVLVPALPRPQWDARAIAAMLTASANGAFEARVVSVPRLLFPEELELADGAIARRLDDDARARTFSTELEGALERWRSTATALLMPPWLGVSRSLRPLLTESLALPVGEAATTLAGAAGLRFAHRRDALFRELNVTSTRARVTSLDASAEGVVLTLAGGTTIEGRGVVVASGGFVAGGIEVPRAFAEREIAPSHRTRPSLAFRAPLLAVGVDGRELFPEGSRYGFSTDTLFASLRGAGVLEKLGVLVDENLAPQARTESPVRVAGDACADGPRTIGAALREGMRAAKAFLPS